MGIPFGARHREVITELLKELFPGEDISVALVCHLTAKELVSRYHEIYDLPEHHDFAVKSMAKDFKKYRRMFRKGDARFIYAALGMIDLEITEDLAYPTAAEIRAKGAELEMLFDRALNE